MRKHILVGALCCLMNLAVPGCAATPKLLRPLPEAVWAELARGQAQDLIVEFESVHLKAQALADWPTASVQVLRDFDGLPLVLLRLRSTGALQALLAHAAVVNVYQNQQENRLPAK